MPTIAVNIIKKLTRGFVKAMRSNIIEFDFDVVTDVFIYDNFLNDIRE